jgi:hypothetical protein
VNLFGRIVPIRKKRGGYAAAVTAALLFTVLAGWNTAPGTAAAETVPLELKVEAGYQGKIKEDRWFPVQLTVTNKGDDLSGDLAVEVASSSGGKDMSYQVHVELPKGSTKTVSLALPGMNLTDRNNRISFYSGGVEKGKRVPFTEDSPAILTQQINPGTFHVGVLARDPDTMNFMALLNQKGYTVATVPLKLGEMFSESMMLDGLDALVVNDMSGSEWKPEQVEAVKLWLQRGGNLILSGGAGYAKSAVPFEELAPVQVSGTAAVSQLDTLAAAAEKELKLTEPFTLSKGTVKKNAAVLFAEGEIPLIAMQPWGSGKVWYAAYDLSLQPVASWQGNPALWESILSGELRPAIFMRNGPGTAALGPAYWEINQQLENFPSLTPPSMGVLFTVLLIYAALVGPALYFLLKRMDKREWAWVAIPGLAVLVSGGIYMFGASGRGSTLTQALTITELNGQGQALESTAAAVFVPKGGTYTIEAKGNYQAAPLGTGSNGIGARNEMEGESDVFVRSGTESTDVRFKGVPFWSVRKTWLYGETQQAAGHIAYTLAMEGGSWKGEFRSQLKTDLTDVYFYIGNQWYALGELKAGGTAAVDSQKIPAGFSGQPFHAVQMIFPYQGSTDPNGHKRALLQAYLEKAQDTGETPMILGWSRETVTSRLAIDGRVVPTDELKLWVQPVRPDMISGGTAFVPLGMVKPVVSSASIKLSPADPQGNIHVTQGEAELLYRLPTIPGAELIRFSEVAVYALSQQDKYEIWNQKNQKYEPIEQVKPGTELAEYRTEDGSAIRLKLLMKQEGMLRFPDFAFEGRVGQ